MENKEQIKELNKLKSRITWMCRDKINAFSPTISPAPKSLESQEIESIYEGFKYYVQRGVKDFVVQKKYMGSYCDIYLHKNIEQTYFVSRNGYKIEHIDLDEAYKACANLHQRFDWTDLEIVIIQSELLPWQILGKTLIERQYDSYLKAHQLRLDFLASTDLLDKIGKVTNSAAFKAFALDRSTLSTEAFKARYADHIIRQYSSISAVPPIDIVKYKNGILNFAKQLTHYGQPGQLYFKPFNILKKIFKDGREQIPNDNTSFKEVNDDEMKIVRIDSLDETREKTAEIYTWFQALTAQAEEGIMIKPKQCFIPGLPPALKVRNNQYLSLIYGIQFLDNLEQLTTKRKIRKKLNCSIRQWQVNYRLVSTPYQTIDGENYYFKNLLLDRILEEEIESQLDPSL